LENPNATYINLERVDTSQKVGSTSPWSPNMVPPPNEVGGDPPNPPCLLPPQIHIQRPTHIVIP